MSDSFQQSWQPKQYDQQASFVANLASDLIDVLAPAAGERILDVGCGTGTLTARIAERGALVVGTDMSETMVEEAARKYPELTWRALDGQELDYEAEFDAVFSNAALHWMPRAERVARGVARALRPGGRFVAEFGGAGCVATIRAAISTELEARNIEPSAWLKWYFPTVDEYSKVLSGAGFRVERMVTFDRPTALAGDNGVADWVGLFCEPLLVHLGDEASSFVQRVQERCRARLLRGGVWTADYVRLRFVAIRESTPSAHGPAD